MGILTAILSVLSAIFSAVCSVVSAIVKYTPWWVWVAGGLVLIGVWLGHRASGGIGMPSGCSCREMMCGCKPRRTEPRIKTFRVAVVGVPTGASVETAYGRKERRKTTVTLDGIAAPVDGPLAEQSRANLERMAGKVVRVETERRGLFSSDAHDGQRRLDETVGEVTAEASPEQSQDEADGGVESRGPAVGVVYGESGQCLNTEQLAAGMAKLLPDGPKEWKVFETKARKSKLGVWQK